MVEAARRGEERCPDLRGVTDVERPARLAGFEPLEVGGEAFGKSCGGGAADGPEALAERGHSITRVEELRRGEQSDPLQRTDRPLIGRVEGAQRVDLVTEEREPD